MDAVESTARMGAPASSPGLLGSMLRQLRRTRHSVKLFSNPAPPHPSFLAPGSSGGPWRL